MVRQQWARPEWHATIDSTNLALMSDPRPGRVVVAEHQSAGLGRRGRTWIAPPGRSLAVSVAVTAPASELLGWVPLLAGVAVLRALGMSKPALTADLKWPNDVLIPPVPGTRPGKVCGVLAAATPGSVVIGVGLNIDQTADELPVPTATSWALACGQARLPDGLREAWLAAYLEHLSVLLHDLGQDPEKARSIYLSVCSTIGRTVSIELPGGGVEHGLAASVDARGALVLTNQGHRSVHHAGDVVHLRGTGADRHTRHHG